MTAVRVAAREAVVEAKLPLKPTSCCHASLAKRFPLGTLQLQHCAPAMCFHTFKSNDLNHVAARSRYVNIDSRHDSIALYPREPTRDFLDGVSTCSCCPHLQIMAEARLECRLIHRLHPDILKQAQTRLPLRSTRPSSPTASNYHAR